MRFEMIDAIVERSETHIVARKAITTDDEYLRDHFPSFPVLPGVLMLEAMVQAARVLAAPLSPAPLVLGEARAVKYARFMKPGETLRVSVRLGKTHQGSFEFAGEASDDATGAPAASGKFTLRPISVGPCPSAMP